MKRTQLRRKTPMKKVNPERRARERERAYGPPERREWIQRQPCSVPGCTNRPSVNAHVDREGDPSGMGRKGDYTQIIPLCQPHHAEYHRIGQRSFNDRYALDVDLLAIITSDKWLATQGDE